MPIFPPTIMNALKQGVFLALPILVLLISGCTFRQSESTRAASFRPYAGRQIGQVDIEAYLQSRVAVLISSDQNPTNKWAAGDVRVPGDSNFGCADGQADFRIAPGTCAQPQGIFEEAVFFAGETPPLVLSRCT